MNQFDQIKRNLARFSGFTEEQIEDTDLVNDINNAIKRLLDDELMMKPDNHFSLKERTYLTIISIYKNLFVLAVEDRKFKISYQDKLDELKTLIG